jgi:hypothetical protein
MAGQQWEYCQLWLSDSDYKTTGGVVRKEQHFWSYNCTVRYYHPNGGEIFHNLANLDKPLPFNPFVKAMGLLGAGGWELVSIQHGNAWTGMQTSGWLKWDNCVAYFKRPSIPGRAVNDPKLSI